MVATKRAGNREGYPKTVVFPLLLRVEANDSEISEAQVGPWCLPDKTTAKSSKLTIRGTTEISHFVGSGSRWVKREGKTI